MAGVMESDHRSDSVYLERPPTADLRATVACTWLGHVGASGVPYADRVLPDGCIDIVWNGGELFVAGPDTGPVPIASAPGRTYVGIRFRPGRAPAALRHPASDLRDRRVDLADLWGTRAVRELAEQLAAVPQTAAAALLERSVRQRCDTPADPLVDALVSRLATSPTTGPGVVAELAQQLDVSERLLHRRCTQAVGYGPKTLDRVLRLRRFLRMITVQRQRDLGLGALAAHAGYADQAHLSRECRRLTGRTPSELCKTGA